MAVLTPGAIFLARGFLSLLFPCIVIAGVRFLLHTQFDVFIPTWVLVTGSLLSVPVVIVARIAWDEVYQRHRAAVLGARLVPRLVGRWPGNIDVLIDVIDKVINSYPGEATFSLDAICSEHSMFNI
jgi:hypothetical protein